MPFISGETGTVLSFQLPYTVTRMHTAARPEVLYRLMLRPSHEVLPGLLFFYILPFPLFLLVGLFSTVLLPADCFVALHYQG